MQKNENFSNNRFSTSGRGRGVGVGTEYKKKSPSTADITNDWHYTSSQLYALMTWRGTTSPFSFTYTQTNCRYWHSNGYKTQKIFAPRDCWKWGIKSFSSYRNKHSALIPYRLKVTEQLISLDWDKGSHNSRWFQKTVAMDFSIQRTYVSSR